MPISKLGQRRQLVIPKEICETLGLSAGDFLEVKRERGSIVVTPKKLVDADDVLTLEEEKLVLEGERQLRRGEYVTLEQLEDGLHRRMGREMATQARNKSRKTA